MGSCCPDGVIVEVRQMVTVRKWSITRQEADVICKDCNILRHNRSAASMVIIALTVCASMTATRGWADEFSSDAQTVHLWPTTTVSSETIRLEDCCTLRGFDKETLDALNGTFLANSPRPGGSLIIGEEDVMRAIRKGGGNLASVILAGARQSRVTRPASRDPQDAQQSAQSSSGAQTSPKRTLRDAVQDAIESVLPDHPGTLELQFGRTDGATLDLSEPEYTFEVRLRSNHPLGRMSTIDVAIVRDGEMLQEVQLVVAETLLVDVVVAVNPINQNATITREDVKMVARSYDDAQKIAATSLASVVGQRAKRYIQINTTVSMKDVESVPLVHRGQTVDLISVFGNINVKTAARAISGGRLGDVVQIRTGSGRESTLSAVVVGNRRVRIQGASAAPEALTLALGGTK